MIKIKAKKGGFVIKGTFDMGYMGIYKDSHMEILDSISEVREWDIVRSGLSDDDLCDFLTEYFNSFEAKVQKNIHNVNNNFLLKVYSWMESCGSEFWNVPTITNKKYLPQNIDEVNVYEPLWKTMEQIYKEYDDVANDTSRKTDVEAVLTDKLPMFNYKALITGIVPEILTLSDGRISFQCSDSIKDFKYKILCGAYDELDEKLTFTDFHNF